MRRIIKIQHTYTLGSNEGFVLSGFQSLHRGFVAGENHAFFIGYILRKTVQKYKEYILSLFDPISGKFIYSAVTKEMVDCRSEGDRSTIV